MISPLTSFAVTYKCQIVPDIHEDRLSVKVGPEISDGSLLTMRTRSFYSSSHVVPSQLNLSPHLCAITLGRCRS